MRGLVVAAWLGGRRARGAPGRWAGVALAVALALGVVGALAASGAVAGDHAARRTLGQVADGADVAVISWNGGAGPRTDRAARSALAAMGARATARGLVLVPTTFGRRVVRLAGVERLGRSVHLVAGRLPRGPCRAVACEVLYAGGSPPARALAARGARLVVVGRATLSDRRALGFTTGRRDLGGPATARHPTLLIAGDPAGLDRLSGLASVPRSNSWRAALDFPALHAWELPGALRRIARVELALTRTSDGFTVSTPQAPLQAALDASRRATPRLTAVAATAAAALAAFLVLAAGAMRIGSLAEDRRLAFRGASLTQRLTTVGAETAVPLVVGAAAGVGLALIAGWARARAGGVPVSRAESAVLSGLGGRGLLVAATAWLAVGLAVRLPAAAVRPGLILAGVGAAAALAGLLAGPSGPGHPLPGAVVPLAATVAALVTALALGPALRALVRSALGRRPTAGPALLQLARDSGPAAVVVAGLTVATGLAVFAVGYAATLDQSRRDRAEHLVPAAAVVSAGRSLEPPLRRLSPRGWRAATGAGEAAPVVRVSASALAGPQRHPVAVLGVPAATLSGLPGLRPVGAATRGQLTARLTAGPWARPAPGAPLGPRASRLSVRAGRTGDAVRLAALIRDPGGTLQRVPLGDAPARPRTLSAAIPSALRGGTLLGLALERRTGQLITATHQTAEGGGGGGSVTTGVLHLRRVAIDGQARSIAGWRGHGGVSGPPAGLRYAISGAAPAMLRAPVAADRAPLPVLADPASAADAAVSRGLELDVAGAHVPARVVGVLAEMPTVARGARVLVADRSALAAAVDAQQPGAAQAGELWLDAPATHRAAVAAAAVAQARRLGLRVRTRAAVLNALAGEPIGREVLGALTATTLLVVALGIALVAVMVRADLRDRARGLRDLEEQGHGPRELRRGLRARVMVVALAAMVPGVVLAWGLDRVLGRAVLAGGSGPAPDPPISVVVPAGAAVGVVAVLLAAAVAAGALAITTAFRDDQAPGRRPEAA